MSIYERSIELRKILAELESGRTGAKVVSVLVTRSRDIRTDSESLKKVIQPYLALRQHGIEVPVDSSFLRQSILAWEQMCTRQANDSHFIASEEGLTMYRRQQIFLRPMITKLSEACRTSWELTYQTWVPPVDKNLLEIMEKMPRFSNAVESFNLSLSSTKSYIALPKSSREITIIKERCKELCDKWAQLQAYELPAEVRVLFSEMGPTKRLVPFSLLTNRVVQWIQEEGLSDSFYVSTRNID